MALEAVVFPQHHLLACAGAVAAHSAASLGYGVGAENKLDYMGGVVPQEDAADTLPLGASGSAATATTWPDAAAFGPPCPIASGPSEERAGWDARRSTVSPSPVPPELTPGRGKAAAAEASAAVSSRRRRRRPKAAKNTEEAESQRRNHIAVERNRRRQMNEYLAVLRSAMPPSYSHRGDQASVVAGAINFVKELEQLLQSLEARKRAAAENPPARPPFAGFFTFPQYTASSAGGGDGSASSSGGGDYHHQSAAARRGAAEIEVAVAESHASVKVLAPRRPRQLLRMVVAMQCLGLTVLHLNVTTTADHLAFYCFSLKMEEECRISSVDEIAAAVNEIVAEISNDCVGQIATDQ